ncbi:titin-like [Spodoptera frugiperda]|uniref:Titin-like n=1 Tax=Spodoptera frugiperda TaxID=7108 RepID=A0A9R0E189_SPOFR|nr:titin-like [Spodoptera frugiperda]
MLRGVVIICLVAFVAIDGLPNHESDNARYDSSFQANGRRHQQSRAYDEEHTSSLDVDDGRMVQTQAGSQWARNSEAESAFDVNQSVKEEFSNDGGVLRHSKSISESHDESQSSQDSSRQTSYYAATSNVGDGHQGPINHGYRPYSPSIPQPVPPIVRPLPIRQPSLTHLPNHVHHDTNLRNANEYYQDNHGHGHYGHPSDRNGNYGHNGWYVTPNGWFRRFIPQSGIHPHRHFGYQPGYQGIPNDHYNKFHKIGNPALDARNHDKTKVKYVPNGHHGSPGHTKPSLDEVLNALGYNPNKDKHDAPNKINHGMAPDINNKENDGTKVNFVNGSDETNTAKDVPVDNQGNIPEIKTPEHPTGGLDHVLSAIDYARAPKKPSNYEAETIQYVPAIVPTEYLNRPVNYDAIGIEVPESGILIPEESEEYVPTYPVRYIPVAENIPEYVIPNQRVRYYENPVPYVGSPVVLPEETGYTNERFAPDNGFVKPYTGQFHPEPTFVPEVSYSPIDDDSSKIKNPDVNEDGKPVNGDDIIIDRRYITKESTETSQETNRRSKQSSTTIIRKNVGVRPLEDDDNDDSDDVIVKTPVPVTKPSEGTNNNDKEPITPTPNDKIKKPKVPRKIPIHKNIYPPRNVIHKKTDTVPFVIGKITDEPDQPGGDKTVVRSEHDVINQNSDVPYVVERKPVNDGAKPIHIEPTYVPEVPYSPTEDNSPEKKSPTVINKTLKKNADVTPLEEENDDDIPVKKPVPVRKPSEGQNNNDKEPKTPTPNDKIKKPPVARKIPIYPPRDVIHKNTDTVPFVIGKITDEPDQPGADKTVVRSEHDVINQNSDVPYVVERKPGHNDAKPNTADGTNKPIHIEPTYVPEVSYNPTEDNSPEKKRPTMVKKIGKKNVDVTPLDDDDNDDDIPVKKPVPVRKPSEGQNNNDKEPKTPTPNDKIKKPPVARKIPIQKHIYPPRDVIHKKVDATPFVIGKITDEPDQPGGDKTVVRSEHDVINQNSDVPYVVERKPVNNDAKPKTTDGTNKPTHIEPTYVPEVPYSPTEDKSPEKKSANNDAKPKTTDDTNKPTDTEKPTPVKNANVDDKGTPENKETYTVRTPSGVILHVHEIPVDEDAAPKPKHIIDGNKDNIVKKKPLPTKPNIYPPKNDKIVDQNVHGYKPDHEIKDATTAKDEKANPTTAKPIPQIGKPIPRMPKGPDGYIVKTRQPKKLVDDATPIEDINQRPKPKEPVTPTAPIKKENNTPNTAPKKTIKEDETPDKTVKKPTPNNDSDSHSQDSNEDDDYYKIIKSFRTINTEEEESSSSHNSRTETRVQRILRHKSHKPGDKDDLNDDDDTVEGRPVNHEQTTKKPRKKFPFKVVGESNDDSEDSNSEEDYLDNDKKSPATEKPDKKQPIKPVTENNKNNPKPNDKITDKNAITTEKSVASTTTKKPDVTKEPSVKNIDKKPIKGINTPNEEKTKDTTPKPDTKEITDDKKPNIIRRKPTDKDVNNDEEFVSRTTVTEESEDSVLNNKKHNSITETEEIIKRGQKKPVNKPNKAKPDSTNNNDEGTPDTTTDKAPNAKKTDGNNKPVTKKPANEKKPDQGNNDIDKKPKNKTPTGDKKPDTKKPQDEKQLNKPDESKTEKPITTTDDKAPRNEPTKENKPDKSGTTAKPTTKDNNTDKKPNATPDTDKTSTTGKDNKPESPKKKPETVDTKNKSPDTTKPKEKGGKTPIPIIKGDMPIKKMPVRPDIIRPPVTPIDDDESSSVECESWEDWEDEDINMENEKETVDKTKEPVTKKNREENAPDSKNASPKPTTEKSVGNNDGPDTKNNEKENAAPDSKNASPKPNSSTMTEKSVEKDDDLNKNKKTPTTESNKIPDTTETPKDKQPDKPNNEKPDTGKSDKDKKPSTADSKNPEVGNDDASNKPKTATKANIPTATATTPATVTTEKTINTEKPKTGTDCDYFGNVDCEDYDDDEDSKTKVNATESPEYDADDEIIEDDDDDVDSNENDDVTEDSEETISDEDVSTEDADQGDGKKPNVEEKPNSENKPDDKSSTTTIKPDAVTTEKNKKPSESSENKDKPAESKKPVDDKKTPSNNNGKPTASTEKPTGNNKITEDKTKPSENNEKPKNNDDTPADNGKKPTKDNEKPSKNDKNPSDKNTKPADSTEKPTGDKKPAEDKKNPSENDDKPSDSDQKPTDSTEKSNGNKKPTEDDNKPNENTKKPNENNDKPADSTEKPGNQKPVDNSKKPSEDNQKPNENIKKPNENSDKPADSTEKPGNQKPVDNSKKPSEDNEKPNENTKKPNENSDKPADSTEKPTGNQKPVDNSKKPLEDNRNKNKPTDSTDKQKPLEDNKKPNQNTDKTEKPKIDNTKEPSTEVPDDGSKEDKASPEDIDSDEIDEESSEEDAIETDSENVETTTEKKPDNGQKTDKPKPESKTNDCDYFGDVDCEDYNDDDIDNVTDKQDDTTKPNETKKKPEPNNTDNDANKPTIKPNEPEPNNNDKDANKPVNQQPGSKKPSGNQNPDTSNEGKDRTDINEKPNTTPDNKPTTQKPKSIFVNCQHFGSVDCEDNTDDDQHNPDNAEDKKPDNNTGTEKPKSDKKPDTEVDKKKPESEKPGIFNPGFYTKDNVGTNKDIDDKTKSVKKPDENKEPDTKKPKADTGKSNDKKPEALDKDAKGTDKPDAKPNTETEKSPKPKSNDDNKKGSTEKPDKGTEKKPVNENPDQKPDTKTPEKDGNKDNKPNTEDGGKDKPENKEKKPVEQNPNGDETTDENKPKPKENDKKPINQNTGKIPDTQPKNDDKKPVPNTTPIDEKPTDTNTDKKPESENTDKKPDTENTDKKPDTENTDKKPKENKTDNTKPTPKDKTPDSKTTGNDKKPDNENPKKDNGDTNKKPTETPKNSNETPDTGKPDSKPTKTDKTPVTKKPDSKTTDKDANNKPTTNNDKPVTKTTTPDQPKDAKTPDNDKNKKPKDIKTKDNEKPSTDGKKPIVDNKDDTDTTEAGKDKVLDTNNKSQEKEVTIKRKVVNSMDEVLKYKDREGFTFKACDETETSEESSSTKQNKQVKLTKFIRTKKHLHKRPKTEDERPVKDKRPTKIPIYRRNNGNSDKIQQIWLTEGDRIILRRSVEDIQEKELGCLEKLFESDGTVPLDDEIVSDADDDDDGKEVSVDREDTVDRAPLEDIPDDDDSDGIVPLEEDLSSNDDEEGDGSKSNSEGKEEKSSDSGSRKASRTTPVKQSIAQRKLMVSRQ